MKIFISHSMMKFEDLIFDSLEAAGALEADAPISLQAIDRIREHFGAYEIEVVCDKITAACIERQLPPSAGAIWEIEKVTGSMKAHYPFHSLHIRTNIERNVASHELYLKLLTGHGVPARVIERVTAYQSVKYL